MATVEEAAERLRINPRHFKQLQKDGVLPRFAPGDVDVDMCLEAYLEHLRSEKRRRGPLLGQPKEIIEAKLKGKLSLEAEKARLAKEQADKTELENRRLRGELVSASAIKAALAARDVAVKDRLLAVPMAAADRAVEAAARDGAKGVAEVYRVAIDAALSALASAEVVSGVAH